MFEEIAERMPFPMRKTRFLHPPETTYAVWRDNKSYDGDDCHVRYCTHDVTIYLVEYAPDDRAVDALRNELIRQNLAFDESERVWLENEKFYQTTFSFEYITKIRSDQHGCET